MRARLKYLSIGHGKRMVRFDSRRDWENKVQDPFSSWAKIHNVFRFFAPMAFWTNLELRDHQQRRKRGDTDGINEVVRAAAKLRSKINVWRGQESLGLKNRQELVCPHEILKSHFHKQMLRNWAQFKTTHSY